MRTNRPYVQIDPDVLERVRQIDLLSYLRVSLSRAIWSRSKARATCIVPQNTTA